MKQTNDTRPRFGWCLSLDEEPQTISERKFDNAIPVVVIPLPFRSPKQNKTIREFAKTLWPTKI